MDDIHENIAENNPHKKHKILIIFDDMIAAMLVIEELNPIVAELFIRGRILNICLSCIIQYFFILLNKISIKKQLKTIEDHGRKQVESLKVLKAATHQQKPKSVE